MSMSEPFLPHPRTESERTAAAEPGPGGPQPAAPEEPDVIPEQDAETAEAQPALPAETPFRTPTPGERLHADDLGTAAEEPPDASAR